LAAPDASGGVRRRRGEEVRRRWAGRLAALIAYYAFFSLFPLLLVGSPS
jgi:uncharacterized BrkB/YihY/UPF0761 family membrane protein